MVQRRPFLSMAVIVLAGAVASCGSPSHEGTSPTTARTSTTTSPPHASSTTSPAEALSATATVSPDQGVAGTSFTFSVIIRGPGTLEGEGVHFGEGAASGANAGQITCGDTARADHTSIYTHTYEQPGTYTFRDDISVLGPPPSCTRAQTTAIVVLVVAAPLSTATLNGAFLSPSKNIACIIYSPGGEHTVRCASFAQPILVTMGPTGAFQTCTGSQCELGNPAAETPVLPYGSATGDGTFQCLSSTAGMTCTIVGRMGFRISRVGVTRIP
jgi:hypothetical protein